METFNAETHVANRIDDPEQLLVDIVTDDSVYRRTRNWIVRFKHLPLPVGDDVDSYLNSFAATSVYLTIDLGSFTTQRCYNLRELRLRNVRIKSEQLMDIPNRHKHTLRYLDLCNLFVDCGTEGIVSWLLRLGLWLRGNCQLNGLYLGQDFMDEHGVVVHCCGKDHMKYGLREQFIYYILDRGQDAGQFPFERARPIVQDMMEGRIFSIGSRLHKHTIHNRVERMGRLQ